jgi:hypothetical protein
MHDKISQLWVIDFTNDPMPFRAIVQHCRLLISSIIMCISIVGICNNVKMQCVKFYKIWDIILF